MATGTVDNISPETTQEGQTASLKLLAQFLGLPFKERLDEPMPPRDLLRGDFDRIAGSWGRQFSTVPIGLDGGEVLVATSEPLNMEAFDQLRLCYGKALKIMVTTPDEVTKAINAIRTSLMSDRSSDLSSSQESNEASEYERQL